MMNCSTVLVQNTWGIHFNFEGYFSSPPSCPSWLTPLQQQDWQCRGIVVWDAGVRVVAHLYAGYALELLEQMRANDVWQSNGFLIGSPTYQLSSETADGISTLENQIKLASDQAKDLFDFLSTHKKSLEYIAIRDNEKAEDALRTVFRLIAVYGRKVREGKESDKLIETTKPNILPIFIPRGNYFTVHQAAQICHSTSKQIRAWIRKGKLEALDLPGLGIIIEAGKLNEFLIQRNS
ncbi:MAG: hypothetical protein HZB19_23155 [Chloroflexi bacterium]|nr:hypothetical protein [Chloroflexota bacterium]